MINLRHAAGVALGLTVLGVVATTAQQTVQLPARDQQLTDKPVTQFSVGAEDGEDWELLSGVRAVAFDSKDNLYVLDGNNHRVLVFGPNGRFVRKISKQGEGPGELMAPLSMTVTPDDQVVVGDIGRRAYSVFKGDGTFVKNVPFAEGKAPGMGGGSPGLRPHPRSGVVARVTPFMMARGGPGGPIGGPMDRTTELNWEDLTSGKSTTLHTVKRTPINPRVDDSGSSGGQRQVRVMVTMPYFEPNITFGVLPTGAIAVASEVDYRVRLIGQTGKVDRVLERAIKPRKTTDRDKKLVIERARENSRTGQGMITMRNDNGRMSVGAGAPGSRMTMPSIEETLRSAQFNDVIPVLRRVDTDVQGRIWIQRTANDHGTRGPIDLVASDGRYIGTILNDVVPDAFSRTGRAAYVERDDLGVEHVTVKRLPATWR